MDGPGPKAQKSRYFEEMLPGARARYYGRLAALSAQQRGAIATGLSSSVRMAAESALRQRYPKASDDEIVRRLAVRLYGRATALRAFDAIPEDAA